MDRRSWKLMWITVGNSLHINLPSPLEIFVVEIFDPFLICCQCSRGCERERRAANQPLGSAGDRAECEQREETWENKVGRTALKSFCRPITLLPGGETKGKTPGQYCANP